MRPLAVALARRYLEQARAQGEPRFAGRAMAVLTHWKPFDQAPADVVLMMATLQQYLHDFDTATALLEQLVQREPGHAQAWLTLATIRRVQGRYAASDAACQALLQTGATLHGQACRAENLALRGQFDPARKLFDALLAQPASGAADTRLAAHQRGRARDARRSPTCRRDRLPGCPGCRTGRVHATRPMPISCSPSSVPARYRPLLRDEVRSDPVLLRLAQAASARGLPDDSAAELRARIQQAALRPQASTGHAREQALFALDVERDAQRALALARLNLEPQREPIDLLLLARAARAAGDDAGVQQAAQLGEQIGLHDARLDALR